MFHLDLVGTLDGGLLYRTMDARGIGGLSVVRKVELDDYFLVLVLVFLALALGSSASVKRIS